MMYNKIDKIADELQQDHVVAYPTEAVFGLGCNPQSEQAVQALLRLKNRPVEKGLILIAPDKELLLPYIDDSRLSSTEWQRFEEINEQTITWVMPAKPTIPHYLTGKFDTIAVRLCRVPAVVSLCQATGFALTSTSANLSGNPACRTALEVQQQFGEQFPILNMPTLGKCNPSEIRDIFTQHIFRSG